MPQLKLAVPHSLSPEDATERVKGLLAKVREHYGNQVSNVQEAWEGQQLKFGFTTYGFNLTGTLQVEPNQVELNGQLPLAAMMFKGKIEQSIRSELTKLLA